MIRAFGRKNTNHDATRPAFEWFSRSWYRSERPVSWWPVACGSHWLLCVVLGSETDEMRA